MDWFETVRVLDHTLCMVLEYNILRNAAGLDVSEEKMDLLVVSSFDLINFP